MQIHVGGIPKARELSRFGRELSRTGQLRLVWMSHYFRYGRNAAFTCRHFGISRQTFYRWWRRYDPLNLSTLEDRSHRPHRRRQPTWTASQREAVRALRREYPRWGKDKLVVLLRRKNLPLSTSMVGRILSDLKRRGVLVEAASKIPTRRRKMRGRPWARRKPRFWPIRQPGDLVQVDTKEVRPARGVVLKHFSARDMISRWDVLEVHERATSLAAAHFLDTLVDRMPFPIAAVQVDGGSEFAAEFETACQQRGLPLFALPQAQRPGRTVSSHSPRGVLPSDPRPLERRATQSSASSLGTHLQHRAPSPGAPLSHPARIPRALKISTKENRVSLIMWTSTHS